MWKLLKLFCLSHGNGNNKEEREAFLRIIMQPYGIVRRAEPIPPPNPFPRPNKVFHIGQLEECRELRNRLKTEKKKTKKQRTQLSTLNWILIKKKDYWLNPHGLMNALGFLAYGSSFEPISARYFHSNYIVLSIVSRKTESPEDQPISNMQKTATAPSSLFSAVTPSSSHGLLPFCTSASNRMAQIGSSVPIEMSKEPGCSKSTSILVDKAGGTASKPVSNGAAVLGALGGDYGSSSGDEE
ncbi:unnamed protein product [Bursaphelenchus okinawaensis]|uniref:Uncharacterized protein n=1 Tax=Bursaphelenchus okinawaensis TaxID=465554 RepID=A0A811KCB1_9BILA|nr:unnamed protein product [Bursaphelenchus okinawaensis]CAG9097949.1 unnamed protein product [Bursaphelenchus okinawaensis]